VKLLVYKNDLKLSEFDLSSEVLGSTELKFSIGRSDESFIQLAGNEISRDHAVLEFNNGLWTIRKASEFGSLKYNDAEVNSMKLDTDCQLILGPYVLTFKTSASNEEDLPENEDKINDLPEETEILDSDLPEETELMSEEVPPAENDISEIDDLDNNIEDNNFASEDELLSENEDENFENNDFEENDGFDDGYDDDEFGLTADDDSHETTQVLQLFSKVELHLSGEFAPFELLLIEDKETFIGRDSETCKIVLNDIEVSSQHAVLKKNNLSIVLEDLNSSNGTILNGKSIKSQVIENGDEFIIGSTTFTCKIFSSFHDEEKNRLMPVEQDQSIEVEEVVEVDENDFIDGDFGDGVQEGEPATGLKAMWKNPAQRKRLIIYGFLLFLLYFLFFTDDPKPKKTKNKKTNKRSSRLLGDQKKESDKQKYLKKLSKKQLEQVETSYLIGNSLFKSGKYDETMRELEKIFALINEYKNSRQIYALSKEAMNKLEEMAKKAKKEKERRLRALKVKQLVEKAKIAVKKKRVDLAKGLFGKILELDPENFDVTQLKMEIDSYVREEERKRVEAAQRRSELQRQRDEMSPGKNAYLKKEWFKAIKKLDTFLMKKNLEPEFITEASKMLNESRDNLENEIGPLLGKARSLKEGQDLKGAYEQYKLILQYDPSNVESLNQKSAILDELDAKSKKLYREAIINESLTLFEDAKQKFKEVQQISPSDSQYYKKATDKLKLIE